jgi:5-methylcytosine-specific restriction enzyme subunit McrC
MTKNDKLQSHNLYQIFSYVKNRDANSTGVVSGMLLYAQTERDLYPDFEYKMGGNLISAKMLNLNHNFEAIQY